MPTYTRPVDYPDFGTDPSANVDGTGLPVSMGYDDSGAGSIPTAKNFNWWMQKVGLAVRWLDQQIQGMVASLVGNDSSVAGTTVKDALNTLLGQGNTGTFNGVFPSAITVPFYWTKLQTPQGKILVRLYWFDSGAMTAASTHTSSGTPATAIAPTSDANVRIMPICTNETSGYGQLAISPDGSLNIYSNAGNSTILYAGTAEFIM